MKLTVWLANSSVLLCTDCNHDKNKCKWIILIPKGGQSFSLPSLRQFKFKVTLQDAHTSTKSSGNGVKLLSWSSTESSGNSKNWIEVPSTLGYAGEALWKHSSNRRNLETTALYFSVDGKNWQRCFANDGITADNRMISLPIFFWKTNPK